MKKLTFLLATLLLVVLCQAQETRNLEAFNEVSAQAGVKVILESGSQNKATIEVENCSPDDVITEVRGDELVVKFKSNLGMRTRGRKATVTVQYASTLEAIGVSSGAHLSANNDIEANDLELGGSSGGMMELTVKAKSLEVGASSGGILNIEGSTDDLEIDVSSGGMFKAYDLTSLSADADASSGGVANFTVTKELSAEASSGGSISYKGKPQSVNIDSGFSGSIKSKD